MLYFDNAATTFPKPYAVKKAVEEAFRSFGANPGRSGYKMGMETSRKVYETREKAAKFFGLSETENLVTVMWANEQFDPKHPDTFFEVVE
jgi:selenocysteine lyase/cysteine desulfurase